MYSSESEQVLQNALRICKNAQECTFLFYAYFTHVQPLKVRLLWLFSAIEAGSCRTTCCFMLSTSCHQLASHFQLLLEASLTSALRRMLRGRLTILYTRAHTQTRCYTRCFKDIATAGTGSVDAEVVQLIYPFCVARIHWSKKWF